MAKSIDIDVLTNNKPVETVAAFEHQAMLTGLLNSAPDPQAERARILNTLKMAQDYNISPQEADIYSNEIASVRWGREDLSADQIRDLLATEEILKQQEDIQNSFQPVSLFGQALKQSLAEKPAMALKGKTAWTPGSALGFDSILRKTSDYMQSLRNQREKEKVEFALGGKLWPSDEKWYKLDPKFLPEVVNTWAATVGDQVPILLLTWAGRVAGEAGGKLLGTIAGATYAAVTAGPDPHDVVAAPAIAKTVEQLSKHIGGADLMISMETGYFLDHVSDMGIDPDITEKHARQYGFGSGLIEYAQNIWLLKPFAKLPLGPKVKNAILKRILLEVGGNVWEGVEELSQQALENYFVGMAIEEQQQRTPDFTAEKPAILEGGKRAFAVGFGVSGIIRAPGHVYTEARKARLVGQIQKATGSTQQESKSAVEAIAMGGPVAEKTIEVVQKQALGEKQKEFRQAEEKPTELMPEAPQRAVPMAEPSSEGIQSEEAAAKKPWEVVVVRRDLKNRIKQGKPVPLEVLQEYAGEKWADEAIKQAEQPSQVEPVRLRRQIHTIAANRGLSKKALSDLKLKHTGHRKLTGKVISRKITPSQLNELLAAVKKARPRKIKSKTVITLKTEKQIASLKKNLISKGYMTESAFRDILNKTTAGRQPKYIDGRNFITQTQGREVIKRVHNTAEVLRITEPYNRAVDRDPEIAHQVELLESKLIKSERQPWRTESERYFNQQAEIITGAPIYKVYLDLIFTHQVNTRTRTATWQRLENLIPNFTETINNKQAVQRIEDYIVSESRLRQKPEKPANISENEIKVAEAVKKIFKDYEYKIRVAEFYNYYYYNKPIGDYEKNKKQINKAVDIYDSKGMDALLEYLKTQKWGVIKSGYAPMEALFGKIKIHRVHPKSLPKGRITPRTGIEYHPQEKTLFQRLSSYMRQVDMLYNMSPKINAYVQLYEDNLDKFKEPAKIRQSTELFLLNLKHYNITGGLIEEEMARLYAHAVQSLLMISPALTGRNLLQNIAFEFDKTTLFDPRNKNLADDDIDFIETHVVQKRAMVDEFFMLNQQLYPGFNWLKKFIDKVKIYPQSDIANRYWCYWAKKNQTDRAINNYPDNIEKMMKSAKFSDMTHLEQIEALRVFAKDGKQAMARFVAKVHTDTIHFLYERAQRSRMEQSPLGKSIGNLMLFPRAYTEMLAHQAVKIFSDSTSLDEKRRALKNIFSVMAGGMLVGSTYVKVTGRKRNPYNPLNIFAYQLGGLSLSIIEMVGDSYSNFISALAGDDMALKVFINTVPNIPKTFIPFYVYILRGYESLTDQKNIDRKALRKIREVFDKDYHIRPDAYKLDRDFIESWQYFLAGAGIDQSIKEANAKRKIKGFSGRRGLHGRGLGSRGLNR